MPVLSRRMLFQPRACFDPAAAGGGSATTWDGAHKTAGVSLSGVNLIATDNTGASNGVRATNGVSSGKMYYKFTVTVAATAGQDFYGVANSAWSPGTWLGANAVGINVNTDVFSNSGSIGSIDAITLGSVVQVAVDLGANLFWAKVAAGNWNANGSADPATGVGGYTFTPGAGPFYPAADMETATSVNTVDFSGTPPPGYANW